jgi:hypothetical protein
LNDSAQKACNESIKPLWRFHFCDLMIGCVTLRSVTQKATLLTNQWLLGDLQ